MPRIPLPELETMTPEQRKVHDSIVSGPRGVLIGPLRAALYNPQLAAIWSEFGATLRYKTSVPPRHTELAIMITARASNSLFEWTAHEPPALKAGLEPEILEAIRQHKKPVFRNPADEAVYEYASELQKTRTVGDATYQRVLDLYGPQGVVELTAVIGYYSLVAMTLNAHQIPIPSGTQLPPDF